jgi:ribosomal protein S18 acetylase RimI-like enzyme
MSQAAHIRLCRPGDEDALALVGQATFLETFAGVLPGTDIVMHCRRQHAPGVYRSWLEGDARVWLAEAEPFGAPVGYLVLARASLPVENPSERDLEVKRIYLLDRFRGNGIGKRLMMEAESHARHVGAVRLLLGVYSRNDRAVAFYERFGFRRVGTRRFRVGEHDYDDFVLSMELNAEPGT